MVSRLIATRRRRSGISVFIATAAAAVAAFLSVSALSADAAPSRVLYCAPAAYVPPVLDFYWADGWGETGCDGATSYHWTVKLINRAGNTLGQSSGGPISYSAEFHTGWVVCVGAYVRSFLYINDAGTGRSDTSGENPYCA